MIIFTYDFFNILTYNIIKQFQILKTLMSHDNTSSYNIS